MDEKKIEQALLELEEFASIDMYENLITIVQFYDLEALSEHAYDIPSERFDTLHILIKADKLDRNQLTRIAIVDRFILKSVVPPQLQELKNWLKKNALVIKDPDALADAPEPMLNPKLIAGYPTQSWYTKKDLEFFAQRTEVYLNLWENANIEDLMEYSRFGGRNFLDLRSALQRVFWGEHLCESELLRLLMADLKFYLDPRFKKLHPQFRIHIEEFFDKFQLKHHFSPQKEYPQPADAPQAQHFKAYLNSWDWFTYYWEDDESARRETKEAMRARWKLDFYYQKQLIPPEIIQELITLDQTALLSPNWQYLSRFERQLICRFLWDEGQYDPPKYQSFIPPDMWDDDDIW